MSENVEPEARPPAVPTQWYSVGQVAPLLSVKPVRVRQMLTNGQLKGQKVGRAWYIRGHEVNRYAANRRPIGRPEGTVVYKLDVLGRRRRVHAQKKKPAQQQTA